MYILLARRETFLRRIKAKARWNMAAVQTRVNRICLRSTRGIKAEKVVIRVVCSRRERAWGKFSNNRCATSTSFFYCNMNSCDADTSYRKLK